MTSSVWGDHEHLAGLAVGELAQQLTSEIDQTEKALEEAELTLDRGAAARPELAAAG